MKTIQNSYLLPNGEKQMTAEEIRNALSDFEFFMSNFQQITNKERKVVPFRLNFFQKKLFETLLPLVNKGTRPEKRNNVVVAKSRQQGCSVALVAFINYILSYLDLTGVTVGHVFPVSDTVSKFYNKKVEPIISGIHPSIYPTIERETLGSSIMTHYKDIRGIRRDNWYELISSGASSIRSDTVHCLIEDECLSGNVEILTDQGFKRLDSLDKTELVAQFDCNNNGISFVKPLRYIDRPYNGDAFEWTVGKEGSKSEAKFISTAGHYFVVGRTGAVHRNGNKFKRVKAWESCFNVNYEVPTWGYGIAEHKPLTALERLGIATQADGSVIGIRTRENYGGGNVGDTICRASFKRPCKIRRFEKLLNEAGIDWSVEHCGNEKDGYKHFRYYLPYKNPKLLSSFLDVNCSYERAREILHEVLHWDGYGLDREVLSGKTYLPKTSYYGSIVKENRDFVCAIALQAGEHCSAGIQIDDRSEKYSDMYRLHMTGQKNQHYDLFKKKEMTYDGQVYCVEVPSGCIVVKTGRHVWVCGNCSFYAHPEELEDAISPAIPDMSWSLVVYLSTFDDKKNDYFLKKMNTALDNPDDWTIIFSPWYWTYPENKKCIPLENIKLTEYDNNIILPALMKDSVPKEYWGDCIDWYHRKKLTVSNMVKEFPTTIDELLTYSKDKSVFTKESIETQRLNQEAGTPMRIITDQFTKKPEMLETDASPFIVYRKPIYGHQYKLVVDPITAVNDNTDYFAMSVFDDTNLEQVAVFYGNNMPLEDYADYAVSIATLYNKCMICPESNVAAAFVTSIYNLRYYNLYYENQAKRKNREPGIRTTVSSKESMIDNLKLLLDTKRIILHDKETIDELETFEKKVKKNSVKMEARKGKKDDLVSVCWIYIGSLDKQKLLGQKRSKYAFL